MIIKKSEITTQPFATTLLKGIPLIIIIFISTGNIYGKTTSIKQYGIDFVAESLPNILCYSTIEKQVGQIIFYLLFSKNLCFRYKKNILEIKLFSREIGYRASYNYKIKENEIDSCHIIVDSFDLQNLELAHNHVYDLLSISYGKEYKVKGSSINWYTHINIGFSINFPGEFYYKYLWIHPINLKNARRIWECQHNSFRSIYDFPVYDQYFRLKNPTRIPSTSNTKYYYNVVLNSTKSYQWAINILIGLIENIFIEYVTVVPICRFLAIYPLYIHISIGTIIGTIEWLYKMIKNDDNRGFLVFFYALFFIKSICVFKIGYYN